MIIKMLITFEYNPETNEYTPLKQEIVKEGTKKKAETVEVPDTMEPQIVLTDKKYVLNQAAADLIGVEWEDRLEIKYQMVDKLQFPIIGKNTAWGTTGGNKLTKALSVSCRGQANEVLSEYGDTFTLSPWKGHEGLYVLLGNKEREVVEDTNIEVTESTEPEVDLKEETFDLDDIDVIEFNEKALDDETYEISDFEFEL